MAKCRLLNLKPPCGYNLEGLEKILLLDFEDFDGFEFDGDDLYINCLVVAILRGAEFIEVQTPDGAKYTSGLSGKIYAHTLETFVSELSADVSANLHLGTKRRHLPVFQLKSGRYFTFGYEAGAALTYANQTAESVGALITITCASTYPLFEVTAGALLDSYTDTFDVDFNNGAYCEILL